MKVLAPAKLNLVLHILPKKPGEKLHQIRAINCQLTLFDEITLINQPQKLEIDCRFDKVCRCEKKEFCRGQKNLILQAAELLKGTYGKPHLGVKISVVKKIPPGSGLAGGSSDAAAVLKALTSLWQLKVSEKQLQALGASLGSDVNYCLRGGLCEVGGFGEKVKKLPYKLPKLSVVVVIPEMEKPSTAWAYHQLDKTDKFAELFESLKLLKQAIKEQDVVTLCQNLVNDFEPLMTKKYAVIREIKQKLLKYGARAAILAGSGLAMVGFFKSPAEAKNASQNLEREFKKVYLTQILC